MMKLMAFAAVAMTVLAGCMLGPDYQRPTLPLPAQYRDAEPPAPGREAVSLADLQWFQLFQDEALQALIRTALQQNYDVRIAVARILEAQAQLGITRSFLFPQVDGNGIIAKIVFRKSVFSPRPPARTKATRSSWASASSTRSISGGGYGARPRLPVLSCSPPSGPTGPSW